MESDEQRDPHEREADRGERLAEELEDRSERLESDIGDAREDWQAKKADPAVPGAPPPAEDMEGKDPPEADYPAKG